MTSREERLSDLINKAGGATNYAYLRGAKLTRVANASEKKRMGLSLIHILYLPYCRNVETGKSAGRYMEYLVAGFRFLYLKHRYPTCLLYTSRCV